LILISHFSIAIDCSIYYYFIGIFFLKSLRIFLKIFVMVIKLGASNILKKCNSNNYWNSQSNIFWDFYDRNVTAYLERSWISPRDWSLFFLYYGTQS